MPIYAYRCDACGHAKDVLQKISDPLLTTCPACGAESFKKQVTAAGFQLKGSGWYVTDFRNGSNSGAPADKAAGDAKPPTEGAGKADASASKDKAAGSDAVPGAKPATAPAAAPASAPSPAVTGPASAPPSSST
ncbi:MAG: zinc ribbon domain-containing protein [Pseudomonadota bacterium]|nr:zinc ribbon domain-containing protein [Pseudomonadota bacterium]